MAQEATKDGKVRELFVEELAEVRGGSDPLEKVKRTIKDMFMTTYACCEEGPTSCC